MIVRESGSGGGAWSFGPEGAVFRPTSIYDDFLSANQSVNGITLSSDIIQSLQCLLIILSMACQIERKHYCGFPILMFWRIRPITSRNPGAALGTGAQIDYDSETTPVNFTGDIAAILIYDRVLSDAERASLGQYLQSQYSLPNISVPPAPTGLTATPVSSTQINLTWNASYSSGGTTYTIMRQSGSGGFTEVGSILDSQSYFDQNLQAGTAYTYQIVPSTYAGTGPTSNTATVTTLGSSPALPLTAFSFGSRPTLPCQRAQCLSPFGGTNQATKMTPAGSGAASPNTFIKHAQW